MPRMDAIRILRAHGAQPIERGTASADCVVLGADADRVLSNKIDSETQESIHAGKAEMINETEFWSRLGYDTTLGIASQKYTPRMIAELANSPLREVRRWIRLGLLTPVQVLHRLPYFNFEGLQSARQLRQWTTSGITADAIVRQLRSLLAKFAGTEMSCIHRWNIQLEGQSLMIRHRSGWLDARGQIRIDFDAADEKTAQDDADNDELIVSIAAFQGLQDPEIGDLQQLNREELLQLAEQAEDDGQLHESVEWFRVLMTRYGPQPETHFALAELLYRIGDTGAARERYYAALELDHDFVEARANLGCVLAETGRTDLAIAAFQGALAQNENFPEAHYHLARALDDISQPEQASIHWQRFMELAPNSPWAAEAFERLSQST